MGRLKLATVWLGGCSGCHMSFLDLDEFLIDLAEKADIVFTPFIDVEELPRGRRRRPGRGGHRQRGAPRDDPSRPPADPVLVSFGDCAVTGQRHRAAEPARLGRARAACGRIVETGDLQPQIPREPGIVPAAPGPGDAGPRGRPGRRLPARLPAAGPAIRAVLEQSSPAGRCTSRAGRSGSGELMLVELN